MVIIKDYKAIYEYRVRREKRLDGKRLDDEWKTIKGTHVMVDDDGKISKGPENLRGLSKKSELKIGKEMSPINSDYVYDEGDDEQDFTHKNIKKLKPIYDEHGLSACHDEWYKFRLADSTKDIHPISKDEADEVMYDNVRQSIYDGWFRNADSSYKPQLTDAVIKNPEMRNAALNLAYENYRNSVDKPLSFEEFLVTPIKMYRGENGQRHLEDDVFDAYTFDRKIAEHFASKPGRGESKVIEIEVRPIDTYGSMRAVGEAEIWIPRQLSPVGYKEDQKDPRMDGVDWEIYNPIKFILEDFVEVVEEDDENDELIDSIMQEAETIKLFSDKNNEVSKSMVSRCADSIQRTILQLMLKMLPSNEDSAFFAGELDENIGERNVQYPEVDAFRERRQKRLDAKENDEEWITIKGTHVLVDENGEAKSGGKLKGMTFRDAKHQKRKESASKPESVPDKVAYSGSTAKRDFNKKIEDIIKSSDDESIKIFNTVKMLDNLPKGTRIDFPDSWTSDDGTKNYGIYEGNGIWKVRYGRKKDETYTLSNEGMAGYMLYEDENERAKITKVPEDEAIKEKRAREKGTAKHYAMNPDGSINGKHTNDFHNEHVSQEERDKFSKDIKEIAFAERSFDDSRSLYRGEANKVGDKVEEEIRRRAALRKKDKENAPINDRPQVEDIYDVLRDCRDFGMPDGFKPDVHSDLSPEKTEEIIKEAFDRYPTDWLKDAKYTPVITIVDGPGRPICTNGRFITLYTKRNLGDSVVEQNDRALVNDLAHELGHYMEDANKKVGDSVKDCLWSRGAGTEIVDVEPGYQGYKDSFFRTYMGKIYSHGGTEVLSMLMEYIGAFSPMEILSGQEYDVMKGKYGRKKNDKESLGYILGVLAGL